MFDIFGSPPDHWTETGVATNTTAPIKVAPIKSIFCIVVLLNKDTRLILNRSANQLFELSRCKCLLICGCCLVKIEQWKSAVVFKIDTRHTPVAVLVMARFPLCPPFEGATAPALRLSGDGRLADRLQSNPLSQTQMVLENSQ
jgi:hypothetical protein